MGNGDDLSMLCFHDWLPAAEEATSDPTVDTAAAVSLSNDLVGVGTFIISCCTVGCDVGNVDADGILLKSLLLFVNASTLISSSLKDFSLDFDDSFFVVLVALFIVDTADVLAAEVEMLQK